MRALPGDLPALGQDARQLRIACQQQIERKQIAAIDLYESLNLQSTVGDRHRAPRRPEVEVPQRGHGTVDVGNGEQDVDVLCRPWRRIDRHRQSPRQRICDARAVENTDDST